jgi:predicted nucleic acid-binding Zn ribbon protein
MTEREPLPLRDALAAVGRQLGMPSPEAFDAVVALLPEIVGADSAAHVRVRSIRGGTCVVEVDEPVWATRVRYAAGALVDAVNDACTTRPLTSVKVVVSRPRETG